MSRHRRPNFDALTIGDLRITDFSLEELRCEECEKPLGRAVEQRLPLVERLYGVESLAPLRYVITLRPRNLETGAVREQRLHIARYVTGARVEGDEVVTRCTGCAHENRWSVEAINNTLDRPEARNPLARAAYGFR